MAKGKYAAKAANRLVQTDNELIHELRGRLASTQDERDSLAQQLSVLQSNFNGQVIQRADKLAADRVLQAQIEAERRVADIEAKYAADGLECARLVWDAFAGPNSKGIIPKFVYTIVIPRLIPDEASANAFVNERLDAGLRGRAANRYARRHGYKNIQRSAKADNNNNATSEASKLLMAARLGDQAAMDKAVEIVSGWHGDEQEA